MWYWALFTMRMVARAGLATAVILWVVGQWTPRNGSIISSVFSVVVETNETQVGLICYEGSGAIYHGMLGAFPGDGRPEEETITVGLVTFSRGTDRISIGIDHWLLCLTFLIATVATSVRWKRTGRKKDIPQLDSSATEHAQ